MKKQLKRPKTLLGLLVTLALALSAVMAVPASAAPTFNGNVETDFTGPDVLTFVDLGANDVLVPAHPTPGTSSGWDIKDVRLTYNSTTDILYVGINSYETVGDADTNGNEGTKTYGPGADVLNLGLGESVRLYFDLNQDGFWDVIAGVPETTDFSGFNITSAIGTTPGMAFFGPTDLSAHLGTVYWNASAAPDLEFQILDFDGLPNQGGELGAFAVGAYMGSSVDVDIIEDVLFDSTSPAINIVKTTNGTDGPPGLSVGDSITWEYVVTANVTLSNVGVTDDNGTPGNPADDWPATPVEVGGYNVGDTNTDGLLDPGEAWIYQESGTAIAGLYSNTGTATGYFDGFPVSATDPSYYTTSHEVGGTAFPVDKLKLLAPWAVLLACAGVVALLVLRKRREA